MLVDKQLFGQTVVCSLICRCWWTVGKGGNWWISQEGFLENCLSIDVLGTFNQQQTALMWTRTLGPVPSHTKFLLIIPILWHFSKCLWGPPLLFSLYVCPTLCNPMDCSTPGLPVHHQLPEFTQNHVHWVGDAIQLSYPLPSPSPPAFNLSQHQGLQISQFFASGDQSIGVSASSSVLPVNIQDWFPLRW